MNRTVRHPIVCLSAVLWSAGLFLVPAMMSAQMPPTASQSTGDKAETEELEQIRSDGNKFEDKGNFSAALKSFQAGLGQAQTRKNEKYVATFLNNIGNVYYSLGQNDKALDFYQQALTIWEKLGNQSNIATSLNDIGAVYRSLGQYDKALDFDQRALTISEKIGNPHDIAGSLFGLGNVYYSLGQLDKALEYQQRALTILEEIGNPQAIADNLNNIGSVYAGLGQYDKALDCLQRALMLREKIGSPQDIATSLNNIGTVYSALGQNDKALGYHQQSLTISEKIGNPQAIADNLNNIGSVYAGLGQNDKALDFYQQALTIWEKLGNQSNIATSLYNIGSVYWSLGQYNKALNFDQRALTISEKIGNPHDIAGSLHNLGNVYVFLGQLDKALDSHQRALTLDEKFGNPQDISRSLYNIGSVYVKMKQWDKAENAYSRARRIFENFSQQIGDPTELADLQQTLPHFYEWYANVLTQEKRIEEALALLEAGRAQGLARQIALNGSDYTAYFTAEEKKQLQQDTADLTASSNLLHATEAKLAICKPEQHDFFAKQKDDYQKKQADAEQKYTAYRDYLFAHYPQFREVSGERPPTVAELKSLASDNPDTLYLTWAILDDKQTTLYALTEKDGLKTYTLPVGEKGLKAMVSEWRGTLGVGSRGVVNTHAAKEREDEEKQAKALYQALFAPLEKDGLMAPGRYKRIVTVSTGPLLDLPYVALEDANGKRLIETHTVSAAIALGIFFWRNNPHRATSDLLCIADPIGKAETKPTTIALRREGWRPLPGAREEGKQVAGLFVKQSLLIGPAAKKADVMKAMTEVKFLHFATHGYLNDTNPLLSGLVLAPEPEGSGDDGVLSARDIYNTPLAARIAVLSACETGRGKAEGGEGLLGLAWAFRAAGCPCVVASQWQVDDTATRDLMVAFYKGIQAGKRKDDALQAAMLAIKAKKPSPFYWAAFQVIGETSAL